MAGDSLKSQQRIKYVMKRKTCTLLRKQFRTVDHRGLTNCDYPSYHPLQNILNGASYLGSKSRELELPELEMTIDEGRVKSKSKRNVYYVFNARKPIREGWTIYKHGTIIRTYEYSSYYSSMIQGNSLLSLSVRVSKKPINVEMRVSISKCLTYIA